MSPSLGFRHAASLTASPMMVQIQMIPYQFELLPQSAHNRLSMAFRASGKWCHVHDCITNSSLTDVRSPPELRPIHPILVVSRAVHIFLVTHGPRPDVWLVSRQLHASRFDMESAIVGYIQGLKSHPVK